MGGRASTGRRGCSTAAKATTLATRAARATRAASGKPGSRMAAAFAHVWKRTCAGTHVQGCARARVHEARVCEWARLNVCVCVCVRTCWCVRWSEVLIVKH